MSESKARKYKVVIAYDGTAFSGWQYQENAVGIQQVVEEVLAYLEGAPVRIFGSSRTDAGVHAKGFVGHFHLTKPIPPKNLVRAMNSRLPESVRILKAAYAKEDFDARLSAKGKEYRYHVYQADILPPHLVPYWTFCHRPLDVKAMQKAASYFVGKHDFVSFAANPNRELETTVRNIFEFTVRKAGPRYTFVVKGDGFLYKQVRSMVGFLLSVGKGNEKPEAVKELLEAKTPRTARVETAPARGLFLWKVFYSLVACVACGLSVLAADVRVDFDRTLGRIKPMHAVGQPPLLGPRDYQLFRYLKEAGIPFSRLHDIGSSVPQARAHMVDIPNVFPDFSADETKAENYDFTYTDKLLAALIANGVEPWFRLGVSIENDCRVKAYNIFPPTDYAKWARVCEQVIRHYTEGWANGFKWKIRYWEIWNEPDNRRDPVDNQQWRGAFAEFCELYAVTARHLKKTFPHLKIGGYGSCGYRLLSTPPEKQDADMRHRVACIGDFLAFARERQLPLDFFSYHSYLAPSDTVSHVALARKALDDAGYVKTELSLNEWLPNPKHAKLGTAEQAAEICAEMLGLQRTRLDSAMIYDARCGLGSFSPLFNPFTYNPHKAYYAFKAFNELYRRGAEVSVSSSAPWRVWAVAACDAAGDGAVVIAHTGASPEPLTLDLGARQVVACRLTDASHTAAPVALPATLPPHSILVVTCAKAGAN